MDPSGRSCAYGSFAAVYDMFMDNIPYEKWAEYICGILREQGIAKGLALELGCGTGSITQLLAQAGYDMIGWITTPRFYRPLWRSRKPPGWIFCICSRICGSSSCTARSGRSSASAIR